jgi:2-amino-4-hydroxy-6-hydroxymethyldihydropteridine diphosphokinase
MILIALGSSLPICGLLPRDIVGTAIRALGAFAPMRASSRLYASLAWPDPSDPPFVNAVVSVDFPEGPAALIDRLHLVEAAFGRRRQSKNEPRTLDLDLLAYHSVILTADTPEGLTLPHRALASRDFYLAPLCDIAPGWRHPATGVSAAEMLDALPNAGATPLAG